MLKQIEENAKLFVIINDDKFDVSREKRFPESEFFKQNGKFKKCIGKDLTVSCAMDDFSGKYFDKEIGRR